jgi:hypothetical protein
MSSPYTPTPSPLASITIPSDGDDIDAASVNVALEGLADMVAGAVLTPNVIETLHPLELNTGWTTSKYILVGPGTTQEIYFRVNFPHGATLLSVTAYIKVDTGHAGVPAVLPGLNVSRRGMTVGAALGSEDDLRAAGGAFFPTPASAAAWEASGNLQSWTFTVDQNGTIDRDSYIYWITLSDESGANALSGNAFLGFSFNWSM